MADSDTHSSSHRTTLVGRKMAVPLEAILVISGGVGVTMGTPNMALWILTGWMSVALVYLLVVGWRLLQAAGSPEKNQILLPGDGPHRGMWGKSFHLDIFVIGAASTMGVISAIMVTRDAGHTSYSTLANIVAAASLLLAWSLLHVGFGRLYADTWHAGDDDDEGLAFPETDEPGLIEFTYLAFAVGSAFVTPDVTVNQPKMRLMITLHAILSFLYSTVLLGFVVAIIAGG